MTTFSYVAVEPSGTKRSGVVEANDQAAAIIQITSNGLQLLEINAGSRQAESQKTASQRKKPSRSDIALFTRRMADLADAGLPLDRVLQVVAEQAENPTLSALALEALEEVRAGTSVSVALSRYPKIFNEVYTQTLRAGEASGQFPQVATRLADFQETEVARRSKMSAALIYPAILSATAVFVVIFLLTFVVPKLSPVFKALGDDLPITTKMLLGLTGFLTEKWAICLSIVIGTIVAYRIWASTEAGAYTKDKLLLQLPILGPVWMKSVVSRFSHVLSTLLYGGVPVLEAIQIAGLSAGNRVFRKTSQQVADDVRDGRSIAQSMKDAGTFPPILTHMIAIGEETGDLPKMLSRVAKSLDFEVDNGLQRLTALVEPIILLTMGVVVGFVAISVILPIYQAGDTVK